MGYKSRRLKSGRVVLETYTDQYGNPKYYEYFDTRTGARRLIMGPYWDGRDRAKTLGRAAGFVDTMELIDYNIEESQMTWRSDTRNPKLIIMPRAFPWLPPRVGDKLISYESKDIFTVKHVPKTKAGLPWNLSLLLDGVPTPGHSLIWMGDAADRNLVSFHADAGHPDLPLESEDTSGDVGTVTPGTLQPTITYLLIRQEPFTITGPPFGGHKELKPRIREQFNDPNCPQRVISIYGQRMENLVRFRCTHPRAETAYGLAEWFKECIKRRTPALEANGVNKIFYWSMGAAQRRGTTNDSAATCDVQYLVITEELSVQEDSSIRKLTTVSRVLSSGADLDLVSISGLTEPGDDGYLAPYTGEYDESGNPLYQDFDIQDLHDTGVNQ